MQRHRGDTQQIESYISEIFRCDFYSKGTNPLKSGRWLTCWAWRWGRGTALRGCGSSCVWNRAAAFPKRTGQTRGDGGSELVFIQIQEDRERRRCLGWGWVQPDGSWRVWADYSWNRRFKVWGPGVGRGGCSLRVSMHKAPWEMHLM